MEKNHIKLIVETVTSECICIKKINMEDDEIFSIFSLIVI